MEDEIPTPSEDEVFADEESPSSKPPEKDRETTGGPPPLDEPEAQQEKGL